MTVSVRVRSVSGDQLQSWLSTEEFKVLILDCRSFVYYNNSHIVDSYNVHCPLLLKRRSKGPLPLDHLVTCSEARGKLQEGFYQAVLVYDEDSTIVCQGGQSQCNITWVLETLFQEPLLQLPTETCFLVGGFNQFSLDCPSLCVSAPNQPTFNMPSPPAAPVNLTPSPSLRQQTCEQRGFNSPASTTTGTATAAPRSPRLPLLRRGPALSLPNLKCINTQQVADSKTSLSTSSSPKPSTPQHVPSGCQAVGTGYECNGPVQLLPHLYLGSQYHASRLSLLEEHGITAVLNVSRLPNYFPTCFRYMQIPVDDNTDADLLPWFEEATNFIESIQRCQGRVLVHCHAGISRSATICLAYLMKVRQIRLEEAFEFVRSERTVISPNLAFMLQLLRFENELASARKADNTDENSPLPRTNSNTFFGGNTTCNSATSKYSFSSKSSPVSSPSSSSAWTEKGAGGTRQLSLGSSPLLMKRMSRSVSLPCPRSQNSSPVATGTPSTRKQSLAFNFNLPVLPMTGARSCALECPDLSPTPSPIFFPM